MNQRNRNGKLATTPHPGSDRKRHAATVTCLDAARENERWIAHYQEKSGSGQAGAAVNRWYRTSGVADGIIAFGKVLRDPSKPVPLNTAYDSGDHLHPSHAGYEAMANAI